MSETKSKSLMPHASFPESAVDPVPFRTMKRALLIPAALLAVSASGQTLDQRIDRELPSLIATYKTLHAAPELSTQETRTSVLLASKLREIGYEVTYPVGKYDKPNTTCYGVVAVMKNGKGPTVLVRTDMDALPVTEATGLPYASTVRAKNASGEEVGVMHACGHDIHMTTLLGTAKMLAELRSQWHGTVVFVGQPAEEVVAGAKAMLADGLYQRFPRPDYVVAFHDSPLIPAGKVGYTPGWFLASSDAINVTIRGVGGHGANPQVTKDPVVAAAEFITQLQTIASRERSPLDPVVVTVGSIHGGTKRNIIPDDVKMLLTVRTFDPQVRARALESITRIAKGVALAAGIPEDRAPIIEEVTDEHSEATYNDPALTQRLVGVMKKAIGSDNVVEMKPLTVSEDVNRFGLDRQIPLVMFNLGAVDAAKLARGQVVPGLHSSGFAPLPEPTIRTGIKSMTSMLLDLLP
jgi:amidohydrolase